VRLPKPAMPCLAPFITKIRPLGRVTAVVTHLEVGMFSTYHGPKLNAPAAVIVRVTRTDTLAQGR